MYLFGCARSWLWHVGSLIFVAACKLVPDLGLNLGPLHWKHRV